MWTYEICALVGFVYYARDAYDQACVNAEHEDWVTKNEETLNIYKSGCGIAEVRVRNEEVFIKVGDLQKRSSQMVPFLI